VTEDRTFQRMQLPHLRTVRIAPGIAANAQTGHPVTAALLEVPSMGRLISAPARRDNSCLSGIEGVSNVVRGVSCVRMLMFARNARNQPNSA